MRMRLALNVLRFGFCFEGQEEEKLACTDAVKL